MRPMMNQRVSGSPCLAAFPLCDRGIEGSRQPQGFEKRPPIVSLRKGDGSPDHQTIPCVGSWVRWTALWAVTAALCGCNYVILAGYLIGGPPSIEPDFDRTTQKSMTDKDVTVAVVCYAPPELKWDFHKIDKKLAKYVSFRLAEHKIQAVNPDRVGAWLDRNEDWDTPVDIGRALDVTYVVYIDLHKYSLYEEDSPNLYRGRAEALISAFEIDQGGEGEKIYSKEILSKYPLAVPRSTYEVSYETFERQYLTRLSEEIGRLFYEHYNGDDIPDAA